VERDTHQMPASPGQQESAQQAQRPDVTHGTFRRIAYGAVAVLAVCALLGGFFLVQTVRASSSTASATQPNMLEAVRSGGSPTGPHPPTMRSVADAQAVQTLYRAMLKTPRVPPGAVYHCPADFGVIWTLTFLHNTTVVAKAVLDDAGCQFLTINGHDKRITTTSTAFWQTLADTLGMPRDQV